MRRNVLKQMFCKLVLLAAAVVFILLVASLADGSLPLWAALPLGLFALVSANTACGVLLAPPTSARRSEPEHTARVTYRRPAGQTVPLRVVRGGKAA